MHLQICESYSLVGHFFGGVSRNVEDPLFLAGFCCMPLLLGAAVMVPAHHFALSELIIWVMFTVLGRLAPNSLQMSFARIIIVGVIISGFVAGIFLRDIWFYKGMRLMTNQMQV